VFLLDIDGMKATCMGLDLTVVINPCNAGITPDAKPAILGNTGGRGRSNGNLGSGTIIDLEDDLMWVIDPVAVGNRPEGIATIPIGEIAVTDNLNGSDAPPDAFFYSLHGSMTLLDIEGKEVTRLQEITVGPITEALVFSPDGKKR
jgi:hypothetical protein